MSANNASEMPVKQETCLRITLNSFSWTKRRSILNLCFAMQVQMINSSEVFLLSVSLYFLCLLIPRAAKNGKICGASGINSSVDTDRLHYDFNRQIWVVFMSDAFCVSQETREIFVVCSILFVDLFCFIWKLGRIQLYLHKCIDETQRHIIIPI